MDFLCNTRIEYVVSFSNNKILVIFPKIFVEPTNCNSQLILKRLEKDSKMDCRIL